MRKLKNRIVVWMTFQGWVKLILSFFVFFLTIGLLTYELPTDRSWKSWSHPLAGHVIAIDAGHGGPDGGANTKDGILEKDISLSISLYLRDFLQQAGAVVVMTREEDTDLAERGTKGLSKRKKEDLIRRVQTIRDKKAEMLLSIHLNSIPSNQWHGAQTFYYPHSDQHKSLATLIQNELKYNLENTSRIAKPISTVYILKAMEIPSALVEVGFLSHPEEQRLLSTIDYQKKLADSIYRGVVRYYTQ